jgi:hypothetical protein
VGQKTQWETNCPALAPGADIAKVALLVADRRIGHRSRIAKVHLDFTVPGGRSRNLTENNRAFCKAPALHEALLSEITSKRDMNRTRAELVSALNEQLGAIKASSAAFDAGVTWEATRLATAAYVILHDGKRRTVSLLTQLGVKEKIPFISSSVPANPYNLLAKMPLRAAWTRLMNDTPAGLIRKEGYTFHGLRASSVEKLRERGCDNLHGCPRPRMDCREPMREGRQALSRQPPRQVLEFGRRTRLYREGAGAFLRDVRSILDANYLHRDPALAEAGIRKLEAGTNSPKRAPN